MIANITNWFVQRNLRERWLLGVAFFLTMALILVFGIIQPLVHGVDNAKQRYEDAVMRAGRINGKIALLPEHQKSHSTSGPLELMVRQSATEQGFPTDTIQVQGDGRIVLSLSPVRGPAVLGWIAMLEKQGIHAQTFSLQKGGDAGLSAQITLVRP